MSLEAISEARKLKLPPRDKFVLIALADHANDEGEAWPKQSTLCEWTCYDRSTVNAALASLEKAGVITSRQLYRDDGGKSVKRYRLAFLAGATPHVAEADIPHVGESHKGMSAAPTSPRSPRQQPHVGTANSKNPQKEPPVKNPQKEERGKRELAHEFDPATVELPAHFDRERFMEFCDTRLKAKSPMTAVALRRFINKHQAHDKAALDQMFDDAIIKRWKDLYPRDRNTALARRGASTPEARAAESATNLLAHLERRKAS